MMRSRLRLEICPNSRPGWNGTAATSPHWPRRCRFSSANATLELGGRPSNRAALGHAYGDDAIGAGGSPSLDFPAVASIRRFMARRSRARFGTARWSRCSHTEANHDQAHLVHPKPEGRKPQQHTAEAPS